MRAQHEIIDYRGGSTRIEINSSERFMDLYEALEEDETTDISKGVSSAYNTPYKTSLLLGQGFYFRGYNFGVVAQDSLVAVINNPVFPEINLFNARTDTFYIQKKTKFKEFSVISKISIMNRWYIDDTFSLEDIVTDSLNLDLDSGKTYVPIYLDAKVSRKIERFDLGLNFTAINLFNTDKYKYNSVNLETLYRLNDYFRFGGRVSPIFTGDYALTDTAFFLGEANYDFFRLNVEVSKLEKRAELSADLRHLKVAIGGEKIQVSFDNELFVENYYLKFSLKY